MSTKGTIQMRPGGSPHQLHGKKAEKIKDFKGTVQRLIGYLIEKKLSVLIVFILCFVTTLISIFGTRLNGYTIDNFIETGDMKGLAFICIILVLMYLANIFSTYYQNIVMIKIAQRVSARIRKDLFESLQKLPLKYFDTHSSGDLMSRLTNDVDNINTTLSQSVTQLFSGVINIIGMFIAMLILNPILTLIGMITVPLTFITTKLLAKKTQRFFVKQQKELGSLNGYIEEMVSGQKVVLLFSEEEKVKEEFGKINERLTKSAIIAQGVSSFMGPINNFINNISYLIISVAGGYLILKGHSITVGVVFSFLLYMRNFTRPINEIMNLFNTIQSALAGAERVFEVIDEDKEQDKESAKNIDNIEGHVELKNVTFSYEEGKEILKNVSIEAKNGEVIAIVGPTGAGKTTIINLLTKFYDIDSGDILIDGKNINEITRESLRKTVSMVLQDTYLFSESVSDNIRYGRLDASDEDVIKAAKMADAHHFIKQLPEGYNTVLSDNGGNLSQGQRQLLAIARAILSNASILILDEATSSIDTRTEVLIQNAMLKLMEGKTTFVIAHRLSTIRNADKILALKDGEIIESGTHDELLSKDGFYANLYNSQFKNGTEI
ncbi:MULTISPECIES: ABC transporter ATP-binding protein [unclassified Clostridium]|uniref:ABC transporter ATP-binding protein n=1 Tax=unclassified Clostridium TaxID=2614128 RepID=UPI001C8B1EC5|nr:MULTISPECIES: ABC transporter ATP-binding protein [unclassified Clostridium]MBX9138597.1 ABC transporter ATP-binding protein [Clostridium sp. K12(2020)]MBX9145331.1 ABC transporter ATP-binding protein [Clostridium sp. K13]MDU4325137.1 ABC transporter ATP-binding protein [Clostridium celatum]